LETSRPQYESYGCSNSQRILNDLINSTDRKVMQNKSMHYIFLTLYMELVCILL
jgi:hypothetical protein